VEVPFVAWPSEHHRRSHLAAAGHPRLLLVEGDVAAPESDDCLEDWIRVPAREDDIRARRGALAARASAHAAATPVVDSDGVVRFKSGRMPLAPVEARLARALVARFGAVVSRESLTRVGWREVSPGRNALDVHVLRLRRRIIPIGLVIRTVRSRGYLMEAADGVAEVGSPA
jgi:DNA-binding response OmpR family regulator